jgi:hypothetical protein
MSDAIPRPFRLIDSARLRVVIGTIESDDDPRDPDSPDDILDLPAPAYCPRSRRKTVPIIRF